MQTTKTHLFFVCPEQAWTLVLDLTLEIEHSQNLEHLPSTDRRCPKSRDYCNSPCPTWDSSIHRALWRNRVWLTDYDEWRLFEKRDFDVELLGDALRWNLWMWLNLDFGVNLIRISGWVFCFARCRGLKSVEHPMIWEKKSPTYVTATRPNYVFDVKTCPCVPRTDLKQKSIN